MIHRIYQSKGIPPHEIYAWPDGSKRFAYASEKLADEEAKAKRRNRGR